MKHIKIFTTATHPKESNNVKPINKPVKKSQEIPSEYKNLIPAITFEAQNMYTTLGTMQYPDSFVHTKNTISDINSCITEYAISEINNNNKHFASSIISSCACTNLQMIIDTFISTIDNIAYVYFTKLENVAGGNLYNYNVTEYHNQCKAARDNFASVIDQYLNMPIESRIDAANLICSAAICYVNERGAIISNATMKFINDTFTDIFSKGSENVKDANQFKLKVQPEFEAIVDAISRFFRTMMGDMSYETAVFGNNLVRFIDFMNQSQIMTHEKYNELNDENGNNLNITHF